MRKRCDSAGSRFLRQLTGDGVVKDEANEPSYKHVGGPQDTHHLVELCDTWVTQREQDREIDQKNI